jgi:hypothetical protein
MFLVPELTDSTIRKAIQRARPGRGQVCRQDRLPDGKHADFGSGLLFECLLYCGGPPQTNRSSWREQENDPDPIRGSVKIAFQSVQRAAVEISKRRLTCRDLVTGKVIPNRERDHHCASGDQEYVSHAHRGDDYGSRSARRLERICGNTTAATTTIAESQKIARLARLRR